jgi:hypothetical protein
MGKTVLVAIVAFAISALAIGDAAARPCSRDRDNPMVASDGFGVTRCAKRGPRYHTRDYLSEGARGYARRASSDPMVWSDARWRSRLMGGYARDYDHRYDRRFRRSEPGEVRVARSVARVIITNARQAEAMSEPPKPPRSSLLQIRGRGAVDVMSNRSGFAGHQCPGVLVLRWGASGSRAHCYTNQGRVRTPR